MRMTRAHTRTLVGVAVYTRNNRNAARGGVEPSSAVVIAAVLHVRVRVGQQTTAPARG